MFFNPTLNNRVTFFLQFIRENQEKRDRAERKMADDNEALERKTRETEAIRQRVAEMEEVKQLMEKQVKDYTIYEVTLFFIRLSQQTARTHRST